MKLAIIGYGVMGRLIERLAVEKGYEIVARIDQEESESPAEHVAGMIRNADAAIDFSVAEAVERNVEACLKAGVPLVEGTTGWNDRLEEVVNTVRESEGALVYGANFSIGVNLFYRVVSHAAELFSKFDDYEVFIEEQHHSRKIDAPSGTALKIKDLVDESYPEEYSITATRAGNIPGTHRVGFDGTADQVLLEHAARSREGFASGSIRAAEWIAGKKGVFEFTKVMDEIIG